MGDQKQENVHNLIFVHRLLVPVLVRPFAHVRFSLLHRRNSMNYGCTNFQRMGGDQTRNVLQHHRLNLEKEKGRHNY